MSKSKSIRLSAFAKVNLHLHVKTKDASGYHAIETLFQEITLCDKLTFTVTDGPISMTGKGHKVSFGSDNLVVRALEKLKKSLGTNKGMRVHLTKNIPLGAGLGGGSSDAAAALWGGWFLWQKTMLKTIPPLLLKIAKTLGADVPFFLYGGRAWAEGIGDKLTPLPPGPKKWLVLIYPRLPVSTVSAYHALDKSRKKGKRTNDLPFHPTNSFEPVILSQFPKISRAYRALQKAGCEGVILSGSGSTVFGITQSKAHADRIGKGLKKGPWDVFVSSTR